MTLMLNVNLNSLKSMIRWQSGCSNNILIHLTVLYMMKAKKKSSTPPTNTHTRQLVADTFFLLFPPVGVAAYALLSYLACGTSILEETTLRFCSSSDTDRVLSFSMSRVRPPRLCSGARSSSTPFVFSLFSVPPFWPDAGTSRCPPLHKLCRKKTNTQPSECGKNIFCFQLFRIKT